MKLYPHQQTIIDFIISKPKVAVWASVGAGKTGATLHALKHLFDDFEISRVLIVGPGRVIRDVWPDEIKDWGLKLRYVHLTGSPQARADILRGKLPEITFITPDLMPWLRKHYDKRRPPWDVVVIDESSMFAEASTKRFRGLNPFCQFAARVIELTGTPASNGLIKLWSQMFLLDRGRTLGPTLGQYRAQFFDKNPGTQKYDLRKGADAIIHRRVAPLVLRIDAADHMTLPETMSSTIKVHLPPPLMAQYRRFEEEFLLKLESGGVLAASNAAAISAKCLAAGTPVLTPRGWVPIEAITSSDQVWDGLSWVNVDGIVCNGYRNVVECWGVSMTPDHLVLTTDGWRQAAEVLNDVDASPRHDWAGVRLPNRNETTPKQVERRKLYRDVGSSVRLRKSGTARRSRFTRAFTWAAEILRLSSRRDAAQQNPRHDVLTSMDDMESDAFSLRETARQRLAQLRRSWDHCLRSLAKFRDVLVGHGAYLSDGTYSRPYRQREGLLARELSLGDGNGAVREQANQCLDRYPSRTYDCGARSESIRSRAHHDLPTHRSRLDREGQEFGSPQRALVFDVLNAGPHSRFTVRGRDDQIFLAHNCRQYVNGQVYDEYSNWHKIHDLKLDALAELLDALDGEPLLLFYQFVSDGERIKHRFPFAKRLDDKGALAAWERNEVPLLIAHPASGGHGLNIHKGGAKHTAYYGLPWSLDLMIQSEGRLNGARAKTTSYVHYIIASGTIEEKMVRVLSEKSRTQADLLSAVKRRDTPRVAAA